MRAQPCIPELLLACVIRHSGHIQTFHNRLIFPFFARSIFAPSRHETLTLIECCVRHWQTNSLHIFGKLNGFSENQQCHIVEQTSFVIFGMDDDLQYRSLLMREYLFFRLSKFETTGMEMINNFRIDSFSLCLPVYPIRQL